MFTKGGKEQGRERNEKEKRLREGRKERGQSRIHFDYLVNVSH